MLVNNAGLALGLGPAQDASLDEWEQMIETNCTGLVYVTRALLPGMVARRRGHVVNMGSVAATYPYPGGNVYGATKAFVRQFSLDLRADLHGTGDPGELPRARPGRRHRVLRGPLRRQRRARGRRLRRHPAADPGGHRGSRRVDDLPAEHVNVNLIELMPVVQSFAPLPVDRPGS